MIVFAKNEQEAIATYKKLNKASQDEYADPNDDDLIDYDKSTFCSNEYSDNDSVINALLTEYPNVNVLQRNVEALSEVLENHIQAYSVNYKKIVYLNEQKEPEISNSDDFSM